jgi:hypothetical protein
MGLYLIPEMLPSIRALTALECKDGIDELRSLKGLKLAAPVGHASVQPLPSGNDAVVRLLRNCPRLEQLEIAGADPVSPEPGPVTDLDPDSLRHDAEVAFPPPLHLPNLKLLCLFTVPVSPLFLTLLRTPLPALRHLVVTPCSGRDATPLTALLGAYGRGLVSLRINTPRQLHTSDVQSPSILTSCPELHYLSLDHPLPELTLPALDSESGSPRPHPLRVLTIPRPSARFLHEVETLLPRLPALTVVRARAVRWLRAGISSKALEAGVQGEMHEWRRRFARRGVRLVDGEWRDPE